MTVHIDEGGATVAAPGSCQRHDAYRRDIVDHALAVQSTSNTMSAIEYLKSHDIDPALIERVLLDPHHRRRHASAR